MTVRGDDMFRNGWIAFLLALLLVGCGQESGVGAQNENIDDEDIQLWKQMYHTIHTKPTTSTTKMTPVRMMVMRMKIRIKHRKTQTRPIQRKIMKMLLLNYRTSKYIIWMSDKPMPHYSHLMDIRFYLILGIGTEMTSSIILIQRISLISTLLSSVIPTPIISVSWRTSCIHTMSEKYGSMVSKQVRIHFKTP